MSKRGNLLNSFIEKLLVIFPDLIAVYEFRKEIALFDKLLHDKMGVVVILEDTDYSLENLILIDLVYDKIQDEFGWDEGVLFANSFSRSYIRTKSNLWHINVKNNHCLLPEDQLNLKNTRKLLYGVDVIPLVPFPHVEDEIVKINIGFTRNDALRIFNDHPEYGPLLNPDCCWARHDFSIEHNIVPIVQDSLTAVKKGEKLERNIHIYGRFGGSGKTQIMYSLMKKCKEMKIPFVYRCEFWKDDEGKYKEMEINPENFANNVTDWVAKNVPSKNSVLFLDEVDIDLNDLKKQLNEKFKKDVIILIISGAKEISDFVDTSFDIYDISKEYQFTDSQLHSLIQRLKVTSKVDEEMFSEDNVDIIIQKTKLWNHSSIRRTPTSIILSCSLSLAEAFNIAENEKQKVSVNKELVEKWSFLGTSPWYQQYNELHDVHAEFLIYNGTKYIGVDKHYHHPLP